jgi:hypothetical protein
MFDFLGVFAASAGSMSSENFLLPVRVLFCGVLHPTYSAMLTPELLCDTDDDFSAESKEKDFE